MIDIVSVTDHLTNFSVEKKLLGNNFHSEFSLDTTIALVWHKSIDRKFINEFPSIRAVVRYGVGYDNIDLELCKSKKIIVANTPDYGVDEVSDSSLAMILSLTRKTKALEILAKKDKNYWIGKDFNLDIRRINTLSLGLIGFGRIGSSIAKKFSVFSNKIGFYDPYIPDGYEKVFGVNRFEKVSDLLHNSDIVSINTTLTDKTKGMVNRKFLNSMKRGSYLINLSRGQIIENKEFILEKLISRELEGYGSDVWTSEPPLQEDKLYKAWLKDDYDLNSRIIINPHTSYYSKESLQESRFKACKTCLDLINGREIKNRIV